MYAQPQDLGETNKVTKAGEMTSTPSLSTHSLLRIISYINDQWLQHASGILIHSLMLSPRHIYLCIADYKLLCIFYMGTLHNRVQIYYIDKYIQSLYMYTQPDRVYTH